VNVHAPDRATNARAWIAWVLVCVIWGTTYLAIKVALGTIPPFLMGGIRYLLAGVLLGAILLVGGRRLPARSAWGQIAIVAFFMVALGNGGVVWAEQSVPSGLTAVLIGTSPFWMVGIEALLQRGSRVPARQWAGLVIGFLGIVILVWPDITAGGEAGRHFGWGVVAIQIACIGWAAGSAYTKRHVLPGHVLGTAALQMIFGGLYMAVAGFARGEWPHLSFNQTTTAAFVYLILAGSVVAFAAYSYALRHLPLAIVSLYTYVNPVIAVVLGTILLGEPFSMRMVAAAGVILIGMVTVGTSQKSEVKSQTSNF